MDWEEARNRTLVHWYAIRDTIGIASPVELLTEINVVEALCDRAKQDAGEPFGYCARCLFYQQFGGCRQIGARMSEAVVSNDWEGLRAMVEELITHLRELRMPATPASAGPTVIPAGPQRSRRLGRPVRDVEPVGTAADALGPLDGLLGSGVRRQESGPLPLQSTAEGGRPLAARPRV